MARMRLDKLLAHAGCGTRSEIKRAVRLGRVEVNGLAVRDPGMAVDPEADRVFWDGEPVRYREYVYFMLNKPPGVISATEDPRERTVIDLLKPEDRVRDPFPVGRLDKDTEGLLLITNDGRLAHELLSPRKHVDKVYEAVVAGAVDDADVRAFASGVTLDDGYRTMPADLVVRDVRDGEDGPLSDVTVTLREGKFHQVKRMFEAVGKRVVRLRRVAMGPLRLDPSLPPGDYRELTEEEMRALDAAVSGAGPARESNAGRGEKR
ncbi:MAG: 16S rRNA pseudouridine(516) synthase [Thermobacillus sp. ZCTH02-B1]|uniref:pseudouridine synthase n=1 Tax=Thermobacillus sp. ZCTH02-B1 TaxID=1858795 RepID=UPI000B55582F|nr:pseudouridine synthase [Thermobacillus sp. ZCTH02-B1]OUM94436.1 MAG: 16S rRNA pseudouridine(516) synthase [Thermobacillus sp. ZCTH02-B1]